MNIFSPDGDEYDALKTAPSLDCEDMAGCFRSLWHVDNEEFVGV